MFLLEFIIHELQNVQETTMPVLLEASVSTMEDCAPEVGDRCSFCLCSHGKVPARRTA